MIDAPGESNVKTVAEEYVSSENVHSAGRSWSSYIPSIDKPVSTNYSRNSFTRSISAESLYN